MCAVKQKNSIVVPIELGRALKKQNERQSTEAPQSPAVRRLMQCLDLLVEVSREIAKTK